MVKEINVDELIKTMSLEEKVGQMFMFAFHGTTYNPQLDTLLKEAHVGGIIHFARNIVDPNQVCKLNYDILTNSNIPPLIGIDQEGGTVQRIIKDITPFPGAMALAASGESNKNICKYVGTDLKNMNYNMVFAPVADVNNNPQNPVINSRSYSDNPQVVSKYVKDAVEGFKEAGIIPTLKHFPGHGDTSVDSHISLPTVNKSLDKLNEIEFIPFKDASSIPDIAMMTSHVLYPALDNEYPASLSKIIQTELLRKKFGFDGIIISDSLTMGAVTTNFSVRDIIISSVNAGMDMLMFCGNADLSEQLDNVKTMVQAVKDGLIPMERVDESVARLLRYKAKYALSVQETFTKPSPVAMREGNELSEKSITFITRGRGIDPKMLPINVNKPGKILVIFPKIRLASLIDNKGQEYTTLGHKLHKYNIPADELIVDDELLNIEIIKNIQSKYDKIFFATYNVKENDYQTKVYSILNPKKTIVVSMRSPYDILHLPDVKYYICIYEATELALQSCAKNIAGLHKFEGRAPIKLD